jgi:hypothetical protein
MVRLGALSGRGEILIGGISRGSVSYAIDECHQGGVDGRQGRITGDDELLRAIWDHATDIQLRCPAGVFVIHMSSYVLGRDSAVVAVKGLQPGATAVLAAA